jgi:hypothetical protein
LLFIKNLVTPRLQPIKRNMAKTLDPTLEGEAAADEAAKNKPSGAPPVRKPVNSADVKLPGTTEDQWVQIQMNRGLYRSGRTRGRQVNDYTKGKYVGPEGQTLNYRGKDRGEVEARLRAFYKQRFGKQEGAKTIAHEQQKSDLAMDVKPRSETPPPITKSQSPAIPNPVPNPTGETRPPGRKSPADADPGDAAPPAATGETASIKTLGGERDTSSPPVSRPGAGGGLMLASTKEPAAKPPAAPSIAPPDTASTTSPVAPAPPAPPQPPIRNANMRREAPAGMELVGSGYKRDATGAVATDKRGAPIREPKYEATSDLPRPQTPMAVSRPPSAGSPVPNPIGSKPYVSAGDRFGQEARDKAKADAANFAKSVAGPDPTKSIAPAGDPDFGKSLSQGEQSAMQRSTTGSGATGADGNYRKDDVGPSGGRVVGVRPEEQSPVSRPAMTRRPVGRR